VRFLCLFWAILDDFSGHKMNRTIPTRIESTPDGRESILSFSQENRPKTRLESESGLGLAPALVAGPCGGHRAMKNQ